MGAASSADSQPWPGVPMIHLDCPCCAVALQLPDHWADSVIRCPECEERLRVPARRLRLAEVTGLGARPVLPAGRLASSVAVALAAVPVITAAMLFGHGRAGGDAASPESAASASIDSIAAPVREESAVSHSSGGLATVVDPAGSSTALEQSGDE
jgi:hypothetical protein